MTTRPEIRMRQHSAKEWQMVAPYAYNDNRGSYVTIPLIHSPRAIDGVAVWQGFIHDAGTIPVGKDIIDSEGEGLAAFINHDYRYSYRKLLDITRKQADKLLKQDLITAGMSRWKASLAYSAVRLFGWYPWKRGESTAGKDAYHYAPIPTAPPEADGA